MLSDLLMQITDMQPSYYIK